MRVPHPAQDASWTGLDPADIMVRIEHEHNQLIALEEHEAMSIAQGANRLNDY